MQLNMNMLFKNKNVFFFFNFLYSIFILFAVTYFQFFHEINLSKKFFNIKNFVYRPVMPCIPNYFHYVYIIYFINHEFQDFFHFKVH